MKTFKISLVRNYIIDIEAKNAEDAKIYAEYYLGDCPDLSSKRDRRDKNFNIFNIKSVYNEASEIID